MTEVINGVKTVYNYTYDDDNRVTSVTVGNGTTVISSVSYTYDAFGRMSQQVTKHGDSTNGTTVLTESATFTNPSATATSGQIASYNGFTYTYDANGNILSVYDGTNTTTYEYDSANQLTRENNQQLGITQTWTYNNAGNILTRKEYAYTTGSLDGVTPTDTVNYTYGNSNWGDLLTAYDGTTITYDEIGNPLNDGTWTYTWEHGRQLASMEKADGTKWEYTYNASGLRTKRTNGATTYNYVYNGSQLAQMTVGSNTLTFAYDAAGIPLTVTHNGTVYYYSTNVQGDVVSILDSTGNPVDGYTYDAWGNQSTNSGTSTVGTLNPLRYRGYVYDQETGLYYLQSRYYDPEIGRFINADAFAATGQRFIGNNMFAYCLNNPVILIDPVGQNSTTVDWWWTIFGVLPFVDGPLPIGDVITFLVALFLGNELSQALEKSNQIKQDNSVSSKSIDWNGGDKNHILKGTGKSHISGWKRFGIDPNNGNAWYLLLPLLKEVVDDADEITSSMLQDGSRIIYYAKTYAEEGVRVVVKIWVSIDGYIHQISDAIPYIIK